MRQTSTSVNAANTLTNTTAGVAAAPSGSGIFASHRNKLSLVNQLLQKHSPYQEYVSLSYP
jgi:hypothetical protein